MLYYMDWMKNKDVAKNTLLDINQNLSYMLYIILKNNKIKENYSEGKDR